VAGQAASVVDEVAAELGGEALPEGVEGVRNPSMHRGGSCAKLVENYQDARKPRSAQGVMPLKVIAVLTPFGVSSFFAEKRTDANQYRDCPNAVTWGSRRQAM
jgi:hypothetical protein